MKPPPFEYFDPTTLDETLALLAEHGNTAVLAGGQSLVPLLNFRRITPERIVDINRVAGLAGLRETVTGLRIGATTRQAEVERSDLVEDGWPLLREAVRWVAHPQIRSRGTVGGSVMNADPSSEIPAALAALDAEFDVRSVRGARTLRWPELFVDQGRTALEPDELLVGIDVPAVREGTGAAFAEYSQRHRHRSIGGAAVLLTMDSAGTCSHAAIALLAAAATPHRAASAEASLVGTTVDEAAAATAAEAATAGIEPAGDVHGSPEYRRSLIRTLVRRAIISATRRAGGSQHGSA